MPTPEVAFAWAGLFGASATGLPKIGRLQASPRCWAALGYGGNGTTYAQIAADVICGRYKRAKWNFTHIRMLL